MAALNSKELGLVSELRQRFSPEELNDDQSTDSFLIRWIRARSHNLVKAEEMLRAYLKRRKDNDIDNVLSWVPPEEIKECFNLDVLGYDAENSPVCAVHLGKIKYKKIIENGQQDAFIKYFELIWEQLHKGMKGKLQPDGVTPVTQIVYIMDMGRFPYKSLANKGVIDLLVKLTKNFDASQPETLKKEYFINAGRVFPMLFAVLKPFIDPVTRSKFAIYGSPSKWKPALLKNIPGNVLPPAYGGTNTSSEYGINVADAASLEEDAEFEFFEVMLPAADKLLVAYEVAEKNNTLSWAFSTGKSGVGLVLSRGNKVYFDSKGILDAHVKQVEGSIKCDESGDYILTFDNTKNGEEQELKYRVDVRSASGAKQLSFD